jgi:AcrR family transcriptional regulator
MRPRAPRRKPHERRKLILDGAERVFARSGYAGADTAALARAGGVSAPALYRYFPTKKDLFLETLRTSGERLTAIWRRIIAEADNPLEAIERITAAYGEHAGSRPNVMRLWFHSLSDSDAPEVREVLRQTMAGLADLLRAAFEQARRAGMIDRDVDTRVAAWDVMAIGFTYEISRLVGMERDLDRDLFRAWMRHQLRSIGARGTGGRRRVTGKVAGVGGR